jgi:hypothetical protein
MDNKPTRDELYHTIKQSCEDAESQGVRILKRDLRDWVNDEGSHLSLSDRRSLLVELWSMFGRN